PDQVRHDALCCVLSYRIKSGMTPCAVFCHTGLDPVSAFCSRATGLPKRFSCFVAELSIRRPNTQTITAGGLIMRIAQADTPQPTAAKPDQNRFGHALELFFIRR